VLLGLRSFARDRSARSLLATTMTLVAGGTGFYRWVEDLSWVDSFYFTVITLATVGYGDIAPQTTAGKLFTVFYVVVGIGLIVALATEIARHVINSSTDATDDE